MLTFILLILAFIFIEKTSNEDGPEMTQEEIALISANCSSDSDI
ncbi:hypothetical protein [Treponema sp.]|nr:hypothetical protein [Treponema sp.]